MYLHSALEEATHVDCSMHSTRTIRPQTIHLGSMISCLHQLQSNNNPSAGPNNPSRNEQLDACILQLDCIVGGLGVPFKSVTRFKLLVQAQPYAAHIRDDHRLVPSNTCIPWEPQQTPSVPEGSHPIIYNRIVRTVCESFASACPNLTCLSLAGCREANATAVFAAGCPGITHLKVQAVTVSLHVMDNLATHLPKLSKVTLTRQEGPQDHVQAYAEAFFHKLAGCALLESLHIDLKAPYDPFKLDAAALPWQVLPSSILQLRIDSPMMYEDSGVEEICKMSAQLKRLTLSLEDPHNCIQGLLARFPELETLAFDTGISAVETDGAMLELAHGHPRKKQPGMLDLLQIRCKEGLHISCPNMCLSGSGEEVEDMLSWLPNMPVTTGRLAIRLSSNSINLQHMSRVFPHVSALLISSNLAWVDVPAAAGEMLAPLHGCNQLRELVLQIQLGLTTTGLAQLCKSLPLLRYLSFTHCVGVVLADLVEELGSVGHVLKHTHVIEYKTASYGASPSFCYHTSFLKSRVQSDDDSDSDGDGDPGLS